MSEAPEQPPGNNQSGKAAPPPGAGADESSGIHLQEVRYPLPVMLQELRQERSSSMFAMEILDQGEIDRIFQAREKTHGKAH